MTDNSFHNELRNNIIKTANFNLSKKGKENIDLLLSGYDFIVENKKDALFRKPYLGKNIYDKNFLIDVSIQTHYSRITELLFGISDTHKNKLSLNRMILCRSLYETLVEFFYFLRTLEKHILENNFKEFQFRLWQTWGIINYRQENEIKEKGDSADDYFYDYIRVNKLHHINDALRFYKNNSRKILEIKKNEKVFEKYFSLNDIFKDISEDDNFVKGKNSEFLSDLKYDAEYFHIDDEFSAEFIDNTYQIASQTAHPNPMGTFYTYKELNQNSIDMKYWFTERYKFRDIDDQDFYTHKSRYFIALLCELINLKASIQYHNDFMDKNYSSFIEKMKESNLNKNEVLNLYDIDTDTLNKFARISNVDKKLLKVKKFLLMEFLYENKIDTADRGVLLYFMRYFLI